MLIQAHPDWRPEQVKAALMNTALSMVNEDGTPYRTFEQGAGRIQLKEALMTSTLIIHRPYSLVSLSYQNNIMTM